MEFSSSITFRLSDDLYDDVVFFAEECGLSVSAFIRIVLVRVLKDYA